MCLAVVEDNKSLDQSNKNTTDLYDMEPIGLGGPYVESMTSYISRLAALHYLKVSDLLNRIIIPKTGKHYLARKNGSTIFEMAHRLNGMADTSEAIASAMEVLTGRTDMKCLLLNNLKGIFSDVDLIRKYHAWCPNCYQEMKQNGSDVVYDPLIWTLKVIEICLHHQRRLQTECSICGRKQQWLSRNIKNGFCTYCRSWLGTADNRKARLLNTDTFKYQKFVVEEIGKILVHMQTGHDINNRCLKENVLCIYSTNSRNRSRTIEMRTLRKLAQKEHTNKLRTLLKLSYELRLSLYELCTEKMDFSRVPCDLMESSGLHKIVNKTTAPRDIRITRNRICAALNYYLSDRFNEEPLSVSQVADRIGYSVDTIYSYFPHLAKEVSAKYAKNVSENSLCRREQISNEAEHTVRGPFHEGADSILKLTKEHFP